MILVDSSVWVDHFRRDRSDLRELLDSQQVVSHTFVIGELACGELTDRREILGFLKELPRVPSAEPEYVLLFIEAKRLFRRGIGWIDVNLVASALLAGAGLWTLDKSLASVARTVHIAVGP